MITEDTEGRGDRGGSRRGLVDWACQVGLRLGLSERGAAVRCRILLRKGRISQRKRRPSVEPHQRAGGSMAASLGARK